MKEQEKASTERVAEFISSMKYGDIPGSAVIVSRNAILDWLGVTIAGSKEPGARILSDYIRKSESRGDATVICQGFKTTTDLAAWANGNSGHSIDFDDTSPEVVHYNLHPSACVIPAVLAVAEKCKVTGRKLVASYVAGMEVMYRIGEAIGATNSRIAWHPTPVIGTIGTVAGCAHLLSLSQGQTQNALGIAASFAGGLVKNFGSMTKPLHAGNAARNGVVAAELAANGFTSNSTILDGDFNFCQMFSNHQVKGLNGTETNLGKEWKIVSDGVGFKLYPSCRSTHTSIEAALYLRNQHTIDIGQIAEITCKINLHHLKMAKFYIPENGYQGKFSIPYCIATALYNGKIILADFTDEKVQDAGKLKIMSKVKFESSGAVEGGIVELAAEVTIRLNDGTQYSHRVPFPKGDPQNPMSEDELRDKFEYCSRLQLKEEEVEQLFNLTKKMEEVEDLTPFFSAIRTPVS
jgi:2-methylcitrate dehydratase PrpD